MLKTYDTTQRAYVEHPPKHYDTSLAAWVNSPSAKTYDATQQSWVERLYVEWLQLQSTHLTNYDTLEITPSKIYLDISEDGHENRNVTFVSDVIKTGDTIEFDVSGTDYVDIYVGVDCTLVGGGVTGATIYYKDTYATETNKHVSVVLTEPDGFSKWINLRVYMSHTHEGLVVGANATIENFKVNGKKYGFTE